MPQIIVATAGFAVGPFAFAALTRWIALLLYAPSQVRAASGQLSVRRAIVLALCQSLFHAGPWSVATVVFVAYQVRSESWAPWFFGGFGAGFVLMGVVTVPMLLRIWNGRREAPNANAV